MKKITRKNFSDLAQVMLQISDREQRSFVGGGSGTANDPYTVLEFDMMSANGTWNGGYVYGWGYTFPQIEVYGSDSGGNGYGKSGNNGYGDYDYGNSDGYDYYYYGYHGGVLNNCMNMQKIIIRNENFFYKYLIINIMCADLRTILWIHNSRLRIVLS